MQSHQHDGAAAPGLAAPELANQDVVDVVPPLATAVLPDVAAPIKDAPRQLGIKVSCETESVAHDPDAAHKVPTLKRHPLSEAWGDLPAEDFAALCADIKANGLIQPIVLFESQVIDGWHRYKACLAAGIEPRSSLLQQGADPVAFVKSANGHRRHLTASQRAIAFAACDGSKWAKVGRPVNCAPGAQLPETGASAAKEADVSRRTMTDAKAIVSKAIPEIAAAVRDGKISAKVGAKLAKLAMNKQAAALEKALQPRPKRTKPEAQAVDNTTSAVDPEEYSDKDYKIDNLRGALDAISEENDELKQRVAVECMDATEEDKLLAHNLITELRKQVKQLTLELHATQSTRNSYMVENGELKKTVAHWRRQAEKAKAAAARPGKVGG